MPNDTDKLSAEELVKVTIDRHRLLAVTFIVETYGELFVNAVLDRAPVHRVPVMALASTFAESVSRAEILLEKVNKLELALGHAIEPPDPKEQPFENGYARNFVKDDIEVEFKRKDCRFVITGINRRDENGFYIHEPPVPVREKMKFVRKLQDDLELWEWDDIGILSGSAGVCIVKDGNIIKSKMTQIA
jgi:hypothetical protein